MSRLMQHHGAGGEGVNVKLLTGANQVPHRASTLVRTRR